MTKKLIWSLIHYLKMVGSKEDYSLVKTGMVIDMER